jgi:hypothetical protein
MFIVGNSGSLLPTSRNVSATSAHFPDEDCQATRAMKISPFKCSIMSMKSGSIPSRTINLPPWRVKMIEDFMRNITKVGDEPVKPFDKKQL